MQARRILALRERYDDVDINRAFRRAIRYHAFDASSVENILKAKATPRALDSWTRSLADNRNLPEIQQRSLAEYGRLTQAKGTNHDEEEHSSSP